VIWQPSKDDKRIYIVSGHYGSGKTEFSLNLVFSLTGEREMTALVDLDIANVYFRSRERQEFLEAKGIRVLSNAFGYDITADLPAVAAAIRAPLEDQRYSVVVDLGGGIYGTRVLNQFKSLLKTNETNLLFLVNTNRPDMDTYEKSVNYAYQTIDEIGMPIELLVNNTHMLRETGHKDIIKGYEMSLRMASEFGLKAPINCCERKLLPRL